MEQLLNITTIPISIRINVIDAELNINPELPKANITTENGQFHIKTEDAKINIDTYRARRSIGLKNNFDLLSDAADKGFKLAYQGSARTVSEGDELADLPMGSSPAQIQTRKNRAGTTIETVMEFLPKEGPDFSFEDAEITLDYQMGGVDIDWDVFTKAPMQFTPGKIELIVEQSPRVEIEYIGEPIYIPRSANPDYKGERFSSRA